MSYSVEGLLSTETTLPTPYMGSKTESNKFLDSVFFQVICPPCLELCFFQVTQNYMFSPSNFLKVFRTKVLDTDQGCHKAACMGDALSRFHLIIGDGVTY